MPNHLKQGSVGVQLGQASRQDATSLTLRMGQVAIIDPGAAGALEFAADRAGRTAKAFSNGSGGAQIGAHSHDNGALLGSQMFVDFRRGGTLQEKVLHLVFENAMPTGAVDVSCAWLRSALFSFRYFSNVGSSCDEKRRRRNH